MLKNDVSRSNLLVSSNEIHLIFNVELLWSADWWQYQKTIQSFTSYFLCFLPVRLEAGCPVSSADLQPALCSSDSSYWLLLSCAAESTESGQEIQVISWKLRGVKMYSFTMKSGMLDAERKYFQKTLLSNAQSNRLQYAITFLLCRLYALPLKYIKKNKLILWFYQFINVCIIYILSVVDIWSQVWCGDRKIIYL